MAVREDESYSPRSDAEEELPDFDDEAEKALEKAKVNEKDRDGDEDMGDLEEGPDPEGLEDMLAGK